MREINFCAYDKTINEIDREGLIESLIFMTGHGYNFFSKMSDEELQLEYDRKME
ncbi:MAG: hypothetical protein ACE3JQ_02505 [Paenisporosarcina sp.]